MFEFWRLPWEPKQNFKHTPFLALSLPQLSPSWPTMGWFWTRQSLILSRIGRISPNEISTQNFFDCQPPTQPVSQPLTDLCIEFGYSMFSRTLSGISFSCALVSAILKLSKTWRKWFFIWIKKEVWLGTLDRKCHSSCFFIECFLSWRNLLVNSW